MPRVRQQQRPRAHPSSSIASTHRLIFERRVDPLHRQHPPGVEHLRRPRARPLLPAKVLGERAPDPGDVNTAHASFHPAQAIRVWAVARAPEQSTMNLRKPLHYNIRSLAILLRIRAKLPADLVDGYRADNP